MRTWGVVYGTRPEAHKLRPVLVALQGTPYRLICSGQHTSLLDETQTDPVFQDAHALYQPALGDPLLYAQSLQLRLRRLWEAKPPDGVIVQGDTATAYGAACAAHDLGLPVFHVEAGVRSHCPDHPWPEEQFRKRIDAMSRWGSCHTWLCQNHLAAEHGEFVRAAFPITGNPGIDRLRELVDLTWTHRARRDYVLVTLHRRESFGDPLQAIVQTLSAYASRGYLVLWPVHPNPHVRQALPESIPGSLLLLPPVEHQTFLRLLYQARCVVTDSGGVQEEAAALGIPAVVARKVTDRPEAITAGQATLAYTREELEQGIRRAWYGEISAQPSTLYGDGTASQQIAAFLQTL